MAKYLIYAVNYNTKQAFAKSREPREFIKYNETNMREAYFCDLARITNTHFWIPLSIKIKLFNAYLYSHNWKYWKTICTKLQTFTKLQYLQYSSSEILENASFFFLRSRLDETTGVPPIPSIDNMFHCQLHSGGSLGESLNLYSNLQ